MGFHWSRFRPKYIYTQQINKYVVVQDKKCNNRNVVSEEGGSHIIVPSHDQSSAMAASWHESVQHEEFKEGVGVPAERPGQHTHSGGLPEKKGIT